MTDNEHTGEQPLTPVTPLRPRSPRAMTRTVETAALSIGGLQDPATAREEKFGVYVESEARKPATVTDITTRLPRQQAPKKR